MKTILKLWAACYAEPILRHNNFTAIYDKGYHTGSEFDCANSLGIDVVAIPGVSAHLIWLLM
jgi:hypothetical protein